MSTEPAGNARTAARIVRGSCTAPQARNPTTPAGSTRREIPPPAANARTDEAKRKVPASSA